MLFHFYHVRLHFGSNLLPSSFERLPEQRQRSKARAGSILRHGNNNSNYDNNNSNNDDDNNNNDDDDNSNTNDDDYNSNTNDHDYNNNTNDVGDNNNDDKGDNNNNDDDNSNNKNSKRDKLLGNKEDESGNLRGLNLEDETHADLFN